MADTFTPLTLPKAAPNGSREPFQRLRVLTQAEASSALTPVAPSTTQPLPIPVHQKSDRPTVTLKREGERVSEIHIVCTCGQTIELKCAY